MITAILTLTTFQPNPIPQPTILTRQDWNAKPPVLNPPTHKITKITIHHTGVPQAPSRPFIDKLQGLQSWSQREDKLANGNTKPQWADIPYHYYIDHAGQIAECRPITIPGDTNTSYDVTGHALVVVEGTFPSDYFNYRQSRALTQTVLWLASKYQVPSQEIKGHVDYAPGETDCPGEDIITQLPNIRAKVKKQVWNNQN